MAVKLSFLLLLLLAFISILRCQIDNLRCGYSSTPNQICGGKCNITNSKCALFRRSDMLYCGCEYCNYDKIKRKCDGICSNELARCLNKVINPKSNLDCICATCTKRFNPQGKIVCSGSCYASGLTCKPKNISAFTVTGYTTECVCS